MPTLCYGYKSKPLSGGGPLFPGTIDLNGKTVIDLVYDVLMELVRDGFTKIFIMNAHFENEAFVVEAMDLVNRETNGAATIVESNWWDPMPEDVIDKVFDEVPFPGWAFEHAAVTETSLMMYFAPELVHFERAVEAPPTVALPYFRYPLKRMMFRKAGHWQAAYLQAQRGEKSLWTASFQSWLKFARRNFIYHRSSGGII